MFCQGNAKADTAAKSAALSKHFYILLVTTTNVSPSEAVLAVQSQAMPDDVSTWKRSGCRKTDGVWYGQDDKPCFPKALFPHYAKLTHGLDHVSKGGMHTVMTKFLKSCLLEYHI